MNSVSSNINYFKSYLPTPKKAALGAVTVGAIAYLGGIPLALTTIAAYGGYSLATQSCTNRVKTVEKNLKKELFKRLPKGLKEEILAESGKGTVSNEQIAQLRTNPTSWKDIEEIRRIAIRACLEEKISEKELGYVMLCGMAIEMKEKLPGIAFMVSSQQSDGVVKQMVGQFCDLTKVPQEILGNPSSREDAILVLQMNAPLDSNEPYHYTAQLSRDQYPFTIVNSETGQARIFVFLPHVYEKLLAHKYPEYPEKPLFAVGTRRVETLSDNRQRILAMTGGTTVPTPNIEANEALSLPFYIHDCYHLALDCAIGRDRIFWNAFGKHLLGCASKFQDPNMKEAFQALAEFCLDKEFEPYKVMPKNTAFLVPLMGLYTIVAGKHGTDDQKEPFQLIKDDSLVKEVRKEFLKEFKKFWNEQAPQLPLRADLTKEEILKRLPQLQALLLKQGEPYPPELAKCLQSL